MTEHAAESARRRETLRTHMILTGVIATGAFAAVIAASLFVPIISHFESGNVSQEELAGLADYILYLHSGFWPVVGVALSASIVSAVVLFQRMSAPLVRVVRALRSVESGHVPEPIVIRESDYLQDESQALNAMLESLGARWSALREGEARLREVLGEFEEGESELPTSLRPTLEKLRKSGAELRTQIADLS